MDVLTYCQEKQNVGLWLRSERLTSPSINNYFAWSIDLYIVNPLAFLLIYYVSYSQIGGGLGEKGKK